MSGATENEQVLSRTAYERLEAELDDLKTEGRKGVAERLQRARELGDLSENAEYHATKDEQALMEARIRRIEHLLKNATIVDGPVSADQAVAGTVVALKPLDEAGAEPERYLLAATNEEKAKTVRTVTVNSPLGKAINGARIGDVIKYEAPGGVFSYEVLGIDPYDGTI